MVGGGLPNANPPAVHLEIIYAEHEETSSSLYYPGNVPFTNCQLCVQHCHHIEQK